MPIFQTLPYTKITIVWVSLQSYGLCWGVGEDDAAGLEGFCLSPNNAALVITLTLVVAKPSVTRLD